MYLNFVYGKLHNITIRTEKITIRNPFLFVLLGLAVREIGEERDIVRAGGDGGRSERGRCEQEKGSTGGGGEGVRQGAGRVGSGGGRRGGEGTRKGVVGRDSWWWGREAWE